MVAVNKIDKPNANPNLVKQQLAEAGLVCEDWGGDAVCVEVSAKQKLNIPDLLDNILVVKSSTADLPADFTGGIVNIIIKQRGVIIVLI